MMKEMNSIKIFRHHLNRRAKKMSKKMKRSRRSNYITFIRKIKNSFSKDMGLLKIKKMICMLFINKQAPYIKYLLHKS